MERKAPNKSLFTCTCNEKIVLTTSKDSVCLSNVQRHIKDVCWMSDKPFAKKSKRSASIDKFVKHFPPPFSASASVASVCSGSLLSSTISTSSYSSIYTDQSISPLVESSIIIPISAISPATTSIGSTSSSAPKTDFCITLDTDDDDDNIMVANTLENPKNLSVPVGILDNTESSGY